MLTSREYARLRLRMVDEQLVRRGINDRRVLETMRNMPRHHFVPEEFKDSAYADRPLPIGEGQTISQPYIVAFMSERLRLNRNIPCWKSAPAPGTRPPFCAIS